MNEIIRVRQISALTSIRRSRTLPQPGRVMVRSGQKVAASDVIAEMDQVLEYKLIKVDRELGISVKKADELIQCKPGDRLSKGDLIAGPVGFGRRAIRAQQPCKIILAGEGQVLLEVSQNPFQLKAVFPGTAAELVPDYGVVVESTGALLQGVWGNGCAGSGRAVLVGGSPDGTISPEDLNISHRGAIICAGNCVEAEVLMNAQINSVCGFIFGGMEIELIQAAQSLNIPVILLEGFGRVAINPLAFEQISLAVSQEIAVDAKQWDIWTGNFPEAFIPKSNIEAPGVQEPLIDCRPGMLVRIVRSEFKGKLGTISSIHKHQNPGLTSSLMVAEIKLQDNRIVQADLRNLEAIQVG